MKKGTVNLLKKIYAASTASAADLYSSYRSNYKRSQFYNIYIYKYMYIYIYKICIYVYIGIFQGAICCFRTP